MTRFVVGVSGASGMPLAITLLRALQATSGSEIHLIVSTAARAVLQAECDSDDAPLRALAHVVHDASDFSAPPASGSWQHDGMIICPCSMASLAAIASGAGTNLLHRAADVCLKERRPLILIPRETPLSRIHLSNMLTAQEAGAVIMPFCPAFYGRPETLEQMLEHMTGRILDQVSLAHTLGHRWKEQLPADTFARSNAKE